MGWVLYIVISRYAITICEEYQFFVLIRPATITRHTQRIGREYLSGF